MKSLFTSILKFKGRKVAIFIALAIVCTVVVHLLVTSIVLIDPDGGARSAGKFSPNQKQSDLTSLAFQLKQKERPRNGQPSKKTALVDEIARLTDTLNLDADTARDILERIRNEVSDITKRASLSGTVIETLVRSGRPDEAWALIDRGYGITRDFQLRAFFASYRGEDVIAKLAGLDDQNELNRSLSGYLSTLSLDEIKKLDPVNFNLQGTFSKPLANALSMLLVRGGVPGTETGLSEAKNIDIITTAASMLLKGIISKGDFNAIMKDEKMLSAEETFSIIDNSLVGKHEMISSQDLNRIRKDAATKLLYSDPLGAIEASIRYSETNSSDLASATMNHWLLIDNQAATDWFTKNQSRLDANQRDQVISGFVQHAVTFKEKNTARLWVEQVSNEKTRKMLELKIK